MKSPFSIGTTLSSSFSDTVFSVPDTFFPKTLRSNILATNTPDVC
jgi:hypothetical protein